MPTGIHGWLRIIFPNQPRKPGKDDSRRACELRNGNSQTFYPLFLHLFAAFCGLAALMLVIRFVTLKHPPLRSYFAILAYQDLLVCTVLAWLFYFAFTSSQKRLVRTSVAFLGWSLCLLVTSYSALSAVVYTVLHAPITYSLWLAGDHLRGARTSVQSSFSTYSFMIFVKAFVIFGGVTEGLWRLVPALLKKAAGVFYSPVTAIVLTIYFISAHIWTVTYIRYLPAVANPELALLTSFFTPLDPLITDKIPARYFVEFRNDKQGKLDSASPLTAADSPIYSPARWHPRNIVMVIMESVGSRRLQAYNAPYPDTPELMRLGAHAMIFDRIYVAQAYTSGAMSALFCSLSPQLGWQPITRSHPNIDVPGIAEVLNQHGYATAFMHLGQLDFDHEGDFLADHGFHELLYEPDDPDVPVDGELAEVADSWLRAHSGKPFFLALWTEDTHHPYFAAEAHDYHVSDGNLNRYLNAIHSTDQLIGRLTNSLAQLNLTDDTLVVITGDHGEAFGEHNQTAHNWTVYDEEMRVPLILINPRLFPQTQRINHLGRQIDIPATILPLLGYSSPSSWQGENLFGSNLIDHAYLFSRYGNYTFGLVNARTKYVYDFNRNRAEFYDLIADPMETHDLAPVLARSPILKMDRLKIEAWILHQRDYLNAHHNNGLGTTAEKSESNLMVSKNLSLIHEIESNPAGQSVAQKTQ